MLGDEVVLEGVPGIGRLIAAGWHAWDFARGRVCPGAPDDLTPRLVEDGFLCSEPEEVLDGILRGVVGIWVLDPMAALDS